MAMKKPVSNLIAVEFNYGSCNRGNINCVLERREVALTVNNPEKVTVKMDGVMHLRGMATIRAKNAVGFFKV